MTKFIQALYDYNICTYYLLPLIKLNRYSFGTHSNFKQCYLNSTGDRLYVQVDFKPELMEYDDHYSAVIDHDSKKYIVFEIPAVWNRDVKLFKVGRYSEMSTEAKEMIRCYSGLNYKRLDEISGIPYDDARLMAIDEDYEIRSRFRTKLEEELGTSIDQNAELISIPTPYNYFESLNYRLN